jgi:hypothetical protein
MDAASAIAELDRRLRAAIDRINKAEFAIDDERTERQAAVERVTKELTESIATQAETNRQQNVRSLRIEAFGFLVLTIGAVIQAAGAFFA